MSLSLLENFKKAEAGDKVAMFKISHDLNFGINTPKDVNKAREFLIRLVEDEEKDLYNLEYGRLYKIIGHHFAIVNNSRKAKEYFLKAKNFILEYYVPEYAHELIEEYKLDKFILEHS